MATAAMARGLATLRPKSIRSRHILWFVVGCGSTLLLGYLAARNYASGLGPETDAGSVVGASLMIGFAFFLAGGLIGFIFGIPRSTREQIPQTPAAAGDSRPDWRTQPNTNLEEISDWLTKILVGVGLTQLTSLPERFDALGSFLAPMLGDAPGSSEYAVVLVLYFTIAGFICFYLAARLLLPGALSWAQGLDEVREEIDQLKTQNQLDSDALNLVHRQLGAGVTASNVPAAELRNAVAHASPWGKSQIFLLADRVRANNWRDRATKQTMERTIPVLQALVDTDTGAGHELSHQYRASLGYALKDRLDPTEDDLQQALSHLNSAIQLRDRGGERGWAIYEFNRALCEILLAQRRGATMADSAQDARIRDDLSRAAQDPWLRSIISDEPLIAEWEGRQPVPPVALKRPTGS